MFDNIKDFLVKLLKARVLILTIVMCTLSGILIWRMFKLQIINGQEYQDNYTLKIEKSRDLNGIRGNIYDRNGNLLAYNELAYSVTIEDNGTYDSSEEKNKALNYELFRLLQVLDKNKDTINNDFYISYSKKDGLEYTVSGTTLKRFLADIYDHKSTDDLGYNKKLGYDESKATPEQVIDFLASEHRYEISDRYNAYNRYRIAVMRYAISQNSYQKYVLTTLASDVSEKTVAWVSENENTLQGMKITEETIRKYNYSQYFAHIIGYTGKISVDEYEEFKEEGDDSYSLTDVIGKSGIEQIMDKTLQGTKGYEKVNVDNLGKVVDVIAKKEPGAGNDVYLSIDAELQKAVYQLLEQQIAGIVYSKIANIKEYSGTGSAADIMIPIDDVYAAFLNNNLIDTEHFEDKSATVNERAVKSAYDNKLNSVITNLGYYVSGSKQTAFSKLNEEYQDYITVLIKRLKSSDILDVNAIDTSDETYLKWKDGTISLNQYLSYAISQGWVDTSHFEVESKYADSNEIFSVMSAYVLEDIKSDKEFRKLINQYMIRQNMVSGNQLCQILYEQGVLSKNDMAYSALKSGSLSAYDFVKEKIRTLEITPGQLGLDPCSGSCVITNVKTGEILACVSYPGYDNNRLANSLDSKYYNALNTSSALPLYNYATQQKTAPGSTFKMITAAAGMTNGVISSATQILDLGQFEKFTNGPKCWIYPSTHGNINVAEAIRDSCNYFFYEVGYRLSNTAAGYSESKGLKTLSDYASLFGLDSTTGIELPESEPEIATEYPVTAAIGQSNHNFTTTQLARYVTAVASSGKLYEYTLLSKVCDPQGEIIKKYSPTVKNQLTEISLSTWTSIHSGMRMVTQGMASFDGLDAAGKTGTAQQVSSRPNHALFVGYAPYSMPEISIATRIAYGYTSHNAADVSAQIMKYYFGINTAEELLDGQAESVGASTNEMTD